MIISNYMFRSSVHTCDECVLSSATPQSSTDTFSLLLTLASSDNKLSISCVCKVHQRSCYIYIHVHVWREANNDSILPTLGRNCSILCTMPSMDFEATASTSPNSFVSTWYWESKLFDAKDIIKGTMLNLSSSEQYKPWYRHLEGAAMKHSIKLRMFPIVKLSILLQMLSIVPIKASALE